MNDITSEWERSNNTCCNDPCSVREARIEGCRDDADNDPPW